MQFEIDVYNGNGTVRKEIVEANDSYDARNVMRQRMGGEHGWDKNSVKHTGSGSNTGSMKFTTFFPSRDFNN